MYRQRAKGWLKHFDFMLIDLVCLQLAFILAYFIRFGFHNPYSKDLYRNMALVLELIGVAVVLMSNSLQHILRRGLFKEWVSCCKSTCLVTLLAAFYLFALQQSDLYSRITIVLTGVLYPIFNWIARVIWKKVLKLWNPRSTGASVVVATTDAMAETVLRTLEKNVQGAMRITGLILLDVQYQDETICGVPVVASKADMIDYLCREWVDELFIVTERSTEEIQELADKVAASGIIVHTSLGMASNTVGRKQLIENIGGYTVMTTSINYVTLRQAFLKRAMDIVGSLVGCLLAGIALLVFGPIIYLRSPGPVIFKQERVGRNGKRFFMYKIRSMVMDAEARKQELMTQNRVADGMMFKLDFDPRIIGAQIKPDGTVKKGIGNFIRDHSIDELPQFWNVLKGDMSLVGTRPPTVDEWEKYELRHRARLAFRPGITGLWQVSGRSNITDFEEVVKLDTKYISEWDFGMDLRILWETGKEIVAGEGAK